jgi:hypothetical protein
MARIPKGYKWLCEQNIYDPTLLPERVGRKGQKGFGGSIDVLDVDRGFGIDFKFVSEPPRSVKLAYLWQMASYHIVSGCKKFMLLFVCRKDRYVTSCTLDFGVPKWAEFAKQVRGGISAMGHADFARTAYVMVISVSIADIKPDAPLKACHPWRIIQCWKLIPRQTTLWLICWPTPTLPLL